MQHEAGAIERDRSCLLNEAADSFIDVKRWQIRGITATIEEVDAGNFACDDEVKVVFGAFKAVS